MSKQSTLTLSEQHRLENIPTVRDRLNRLHQFAVLLEGQTALLRRRSELGELAINAAPADIGAAMESIVGDMFCELITLDCYAKGLDSIQAPDGDQNDLLKAAGAR